MTEDTPCPAQEGRALWRRWRAAPLDACPARLDPMVIAAWADGRLSPAEAEVVEAALARDPAALDLATAARAAALGRERDGQDRAAVPLALIRAARALVPGRLALAGRALGWAAALAGLLIVGVGGYDMGARYADDTTADTAVAYASWDVGHGVDP